MIFNMHCLLVFMASSLSIIILMDKLKEIMALKKPKEKVTLQKNVIEQKKEQFAKLQEEEKKVKQQEEIKKLEEISQFYGKTRKIAKVQPEPEPPFSVQEVKARLRKLYQPATLFGESPNRRYQRLLKAQKFQQSHPNEDMKLYDEDFIRKVRENEQFEQLDAKYREMLIEPKILNDLATRKKKQEMVKTEGKKSFEQMCEEVHLWLMKLIKAWGEAIEQGMQSGSQEQLGRYHNKLELLQKTTQEMSSFYPVLKQKSGDRDMIESIYYIMNCCLVREYVEANTRYIELSIGNAPWPMGVAMLGITVKKNAQRLSYVLDNEITRKWILGLKRLITVSQELYPNEDQMKQVGYTVNKMT